MAELVDPQTRELVLRVLADTGHAEFVIARVRAAIAADPHLGGRLALWARRLVGEALAQAYRVVADRQSLAGLLGETAGADGDGVAVLVGEAVEELVVVGDPAAEAEITA